MASGEATMDGNGFLDEFALRMQPLDLL